RGSEIQAGDLELFRRSSPPPLSATQPMAAITGDRTPTRPLSARLLDEEKREIMAAVERCNGNIAGAARALGINRSTLYYRMRKHGLEHLLPTKVVGPGEEGGGEPS